MPENTIGKIILEAGSRAQAQTGGGAPGLSGLIGGDSGAEGAATKVQKETRGWQGRMLNSMQGQPRWWSRMFKTMGIQVGLSGILKQSQIFTSTIGSLFQILGAFVDVILAPFVPLFIPALRWLARKLPDVAKMSESFVEKAKVWGTKLVEFLSNPIKHFKEWWVGTWSAVQTWGNSLWNQVKWALGDFLGSIPIVGGKVPVSLQRPEPSAASQAPEGEESDWGGTAQAAADKAWKAYLATAAARAAAKVGATVARTTVPTAGLARPIGKVIDWGEEALELPNKIANAIVKTAIKTPFQVGGSVLDAAAGGRLPIPQWARLGGAGGADLAQSTSGWGAFGLADDIPTSPSLLRRGLNLAGNIPGSGLLNNSMLRTLGRGVTGPVGTGVAAMYETSEGIYDTMNLAKEDKPWFGGINPNAFGMDKFKPWKKDAWLPSPDTNLLTGKLDEVIMRGLGTAMIPLGGIFGGQVGANIGMGVSEYTAWGTGTQRQDLYGDFAYPTVSDIGSSISDGFRKALSNIPGIN